MKTFYITFGFDHALNGHFLSIFAENEENARKAATYMFPTRWAGIYTKKPDGIEIHSAGTAEKLIANASHCGWIST